MLLLDPSPGHNKKSVQILDVPAYSACDNGRCSLSEDIYIVSLGYLAPSKGGLLFPLVVVRLCTLQGAVLSAYGGHVNGRVSTVS